MWYGHARWNLFVHSVLMWCTDLSLWKGKLFKKFWIFISIQKLHEINVIKFLRLNYSGSSRMTLLLVPLALCFCTFITWSSNTPVGYHIAGVIMKTSEGERGRNSQGVEERRVLARDDGLSDSELNANQAFCWSMEARRKCHPSGQACRWGSLRNYWRRSAEGRRRKMEACRKQSKEETGISKKRNALPVKEAPSTSARKAVTQGSHLCLLKQVSR